MTGIPAWALGLLAIALAGAWTDKDADDDAPPTAPAKTAPAPGKVSTDAAAQKRGGIELAVPRAATVPRQRHAYGTVLDPGLLAQAVAAAIAAKGEDRAAQSRLEASQAAFERSQHLYKADRNISQAELQAAEAAYQADAATAAAAAARKRAVAASSLGDWGPVLGAAIWNGDPLVDRLIAGKALLIRVATPADEPAPEAAILAGSRVRLVYLSPAGRVDPRSPGVASLFTADADPHLQPGMAVDVLVSTKDTVTGALVPDSAVVRWQGGDWIYVATGPGAFTRRQIATDTPVEGGYMVSGLPAGQQIAVGGAQL
ncbi:MAG TPA: hypothetical protein VKS60_22585, partial [Stellaceae bacterium]|nr:hypothetical protein [Stellaceae bacterium]